MELSHYGRFFTRHLALILGTAVLVAVVAGVVSAVQKVQFQAAGSVLVRVQDSRPLADYDYDQFYATQASELYASNIVSWLNSGQVKDDIKRDANIGKARIVGKKNGGTVELTVTAPTSADAQAGIRSANELIARRTSQIVPGPSRSSLQTVANPTSVQERKPQPVRDAAIGFVAGLILGLALALIAEAVSPSRRRR